MQVAQGWVVIGLSALGVTMTAAGIAVALYCHRQDRAKVAEIETGVARAAYAAAVATASQVQGGEWEEGMAQAIEAGATTGRGGGAGARGATTAPGGVSRGGGPGNFWDRSPRGGGNNGVVFLSQQIVEVPLYFPISPSLPESGCIR